MRILVINGSPKGSRSNTYKLTNAFLEGMKEEIAKAKSNGGKIETEELQVNRLNIGSCKGCFSCWNKTPGKCCIQDDMGDVIQKLLWAEVTIWSFPLYYFTVPGGLKNLIDRQLPMELPFMVENDDQTGSGAHPHRYDMSKKKTVVISTCGFYSAEKNYDGVCSLFDHMCGKERYTTIFCGQGELFRVPELSQRTDEYLGYVREAGREYVLYVLGEGGACGRDVSQAGGGDGIHPQTRAKLEELLYPKEIFESMADASWGIDKETGEQESDALIFTRQMAALYRKESYSGTDFVLEMDYTDIGECYQIVLGKEGSQVFTDLSRRFDTRIETPITVWKTIAAGQMRGDEALMKHLYRVEGDFNLMIHWERYFAGTTKDAGVAVHGGVNGQGAGVDGKGDGASGRGTAGLHVPRKSTNMNILLVPWIVFWAAVPINGFWGALGTLAACTLTALVFFQNKKTFYDVLSAALVTGFCIASLLNVPQRIVVPLAYFSFGLMWTATCFGKIPLTAHYSMNDYNGEGMLSNPLFIKTNWILTLVWGILYLLTPIWTYFIMGTKVGGWIGAVNSILPCLMGIFTVWFQKWYPARVARG